jgi:hypothetical protein
VLRDGDDVMDHRRLRGWQRQSAVKWLPQKKVVATKKSGGHKKKWWPQKKVVATKKSGGHEKKWWPQKKVVRHLAEKNSVYESESRYFLVASLISLTVGDNT